MFKELANTYSHTFVPFHPAAPAADRTAWEQLDSSLVSLLVKDGERCAEESWPALTATDYLDFTRTGGRAFFEGKLFARRTLLNSMLLAECAEHQGRFLDSVLNGI